MPERLRVVIADDRSRSRDALKALLATRLDIDVVGEASDGRGALGLVETRRPNVVLMDARMPTMDGLVATRTIKERWPEIRVVVLTMYGSHRADALAAGADAFLIKGCSADDILEAVISCGESGGCPDPSSAARVK
jgi:DNA-binding NarL/FixJ family response regulator